MTRRRDHSSEHRRRIQLANQLGFSSVNERRRSPSRIRSQRDLEALPGRAREVREGALRAVSIARADGVDVETAARLAGVSPAAVRFYAGDALSGPNPSAADRLFRPMRLYSDGQTVDVDVRGSRVASVLADHHNAVRAYLTKGDVKPLRRFDGKRVGGRTLETDPDVLDAMARRGSFNSDGPYMAVST